MATKTEYTITGRIINTANETTSFHPFSLTYRQTFDHLTPAKEAMHQLIDWMNHHNVKGIVSLKQDVQSISVTSLRTLH